MSFNTFIHTVDTKGKLQSSVSPSAGNDLANKTYVDNAIAAGGGDWLASVVSQLSTPPGSPSSGDRYLVDASATGAWAGKEDSVMEWNGSSWDDTSPNEGMHVFIEGGTGSLGGDIVAVYSGSAWVKGASLNGALVGSQSLGDIASSGGSVATARTNLGLGSLATASSVNLGTDVSGTLAVSSGGTGGGTAADARTNLGLGSSSTVDTASANSDSGKIALLGTVSSSVAAVTVNSSGAIVDASISSSDVSGLGTAATADLASSSSDNGKIPALASGISGGDIACKVGSSGTLEGVSSFTVSNISDAGDAASKNVVSSLSLTSGRVFVADSSSTFSAGDLLKIKSDGTIEPGSAGGTGTVTSVAVSGGTTGITVTGSPITGSGTITLAGTIAVTAGGTGITSISAGEVLYASGSNTIAAAAPGSTSGVQAYDAGLTSIAGLTTAVDKMIYTTALDTYDTTSLTSFARSMLAGADAAAVRSTLSLGDAAEKNVATSITAGRVAVIASGTITPNAAVALSSSGELTSASISTSDVSGYGEFSEPIKVPLTYEAPTTAQSYAPTSVDSASQEYVLDLSNLTSGDTFTLPAPGSGDVGKSISIKVMSGMGSTNKLTISISGGNDKMDGLASVDLDQDYQRLTFTAIQAATGAGIDVYSLG